MTEIKKSIQYQPTDKRLFWIMLRSEYLQWKLNRTPLWCIRKRNRLFKKLFAKIDGNPYTILSPFHAQQGNNTYLGKNFFCNANCQIVDHAEVHIGDNVLFAPNVTILTISHSLDAEQRRVNYFDNSFEPQKRGNLEVDAPVVIGDDVWLATGVTVCPGVTIGSRSVIGAGSVVTRDIPENVLAYGIPCRVVRKITDADRIKIDPEVSIHFR